MRNADLGTSLNCILLTPLVLAATRLAPAGDGEAGAPSSVGAIGSTEDV